MNNRSIVLGITGSIAAYKSLELIRDLKKSGWTVYPVMTKHAESFVTKLSVEVLAQQKVLTDSHIELDKLADLMVVVPCTANAMAKFSHGIADDTLSATFLNFRGKKIIVPAMHDGMYENSITQENIQRLIRHGVCILGPAVGDLASGDFGKGRLVPVSSIGTVLKALSNLSTDDHLNLQKLNGKTIVVSAGGTSEPIDKVRTITNNSSGQLGKTIADILSVYGVNVHLVSSHTYDPQGYACHTVQTVADMKAKVLELSKKADAIFVAAAVSDFKPKQYHDEKIKRESALHVELEATDDILASVTSKKNWTGVAVGFCLEDNDLESVAKKKLIKKNADFIVANSSENIGNHTRTFEIFGKSSPVKPKQHSEIRHIFRGDNLTVPESAIQMILNTVSGRH